MRKNVPGSSRINMIKGLAYSPSAPCEWGMNIWQRTCAADLYRFIGISATPSAL